MPTLTSRKGIGGPKTLEGKRRVSLNALKHGLWADSPQAQEQITEIVGVDYQSVLAEMRGYYQPADPVEELLVRRVARCTWRLMITEAMEDRIIERRGIGYSPGRSWERVILHERRIDIQLHRAIAALARKREQKNSQNKLPNLPSPSVPHAQPDPEFVPSDDPRLPTHDPRPATHDPRNTPPPIPVHEEAASEAPDPRPLAPDSSSGVSCP